MSDSPSGRRTSGWQTGMIGWGVATVLAVGFFVALSFAQGYRLFSPAMPATPLPTETPTATSTATATADRRPGTPGVEAVAAGVTPSWEPATPFEATIQAVVLNVLGNMPTVTPPAAPDAPDATATPAPSAGAGASAQDGSVALWLSALTAITALIGLVSTVLLNWRGERREVEQARAELTKTQLEVEKLRRELGQ